MAVLNTGTIIAVAEEVNIGEGKATAWANTDVVSGLAEDSGLTPTVESLERKNFNGSFLDCKSLSGNESTSGSLNLEAALLTKTGTEAGKLNGHLIYKSGLGKYVEKAAKVTGNTISVEADPVTNPTIYDLYRLSLPSEARTTLAVKEYIGGTGETLTHKGVVVDSIEFDFSAGQIVKVATSVSGVAFTPASGETVLSKPSCGGTPFITKSIGFMVDGTTVKASNLKLNISNGVVDRNYVTSTGIGDKVVVKKSVSLNYDLDFTDISFYTKLKNNTEAAIFIDLINGLGDVIKIYLPVVSYKTAGKTNDGGIISVSLESMASGDAEGHALYIATKKV